MVQNNKTYNNYLYQELRPINATNILEHYQSLRWSATGAYMGVGGGSCKQDYYMGKLKATIAIGAMVGINIEACN